MLTMHKTLSADLPLPLCHTANGPIQGEDGVALRHVAPAGSFHISGDAMKTVIEVEPVTDRQPSGFGHLRLYHHGCDQIPLIKHRNPLTEQYTLQCVCSLTIRLPASGPAVEAFDLTAIDRQPRTIPGGAYASTVLGELEVITKGAA